MERHVARPLFRPTQHRSLLLHPPVAQLLQPAGQRCEQNGGPVAAEPKLHFSSRRPCWWDRGAVEALRGQSDRAE